MTRTERTLLAATLLTVLAASPATAQLGYHAPHAAGDATIAPAQYGPYNVSVLGGGPGLIKPLVDDDSVTQAAAAWTLSGWVRSTSVASATQFLFGVGEPTDEDSRFLGTVNGKLMLRLGYGNTLQSHAALTPGEWHFVAATSTGGQLSLYLDGARVATEPVAARHLVLGNVRGVLELAPAFPNRIRPALQMGWASGQQFGPNEEQMEEQWFGDNPLGAAATHFGGTLAGVTLLRSALAEADIKKLHAARPEFATLMYEDASKPWPLQTHNQAGYRAPQDPAIVPHSAAPYSQPVATRPYSGPVLVRNTSAGGSNQWTLRGGWMLATEADAAQSAARLSVTGLDTKGWMAATVPGTVLTTMIDRGVYPDPYYGLNNLAIPETLNKQSYWYRTEFAVPAEAVGRDLSLTFEGINYAAEVWLNGQRLGDIRGAFVRGTFDITAAVHRDGLNTLAVKIAPPPHPGIPNEQSIHGGPGENGGSMLLDGPTFVATEGWDWVPAIRDRDSGIWQPVVLTATQAVKLGDAQVITRLPLPATDRATVDITLPLTNATSAPVTGTVTASFEGGVSVNKPITLAPGETVVHLSPQEFAALRVEHPRLWWPNGYGKPELYHLKLAFTTDAGVSDQTTVQFGIREITYELSLFGADGQLDRVAVTPAEAAPLGVPLVNTTHDGIRQIPTGWAYSLAAGSEGNAAIQPLPNPDHLTELVVRVNGVRIAARGGNWGMDDARKQVSREHLEPYFRLHQLAGLNIIRNWVGQSTEETFYDLADEYGLLIWNDFWESTEDYNIEAQDPALFLRNAADVIARFRNHPSILLWCGRNEGVPQPILNQGLDQLIRQLDGTRYYAPSSNGIDLQGSGPYHYQDAARYYTVLNRGFSVETGTASFPTLESFAASTPKADQWPISDDWAYHDWHASGNGDTAPFMDAMQRMFGAATNLADFDRKAQMLNYVNHRAMFEGFNAHLFQPNSGRMLWMTQPAWPSTMWQILSSDYDTQASFYGTKKACEPLHVQLELSNNTVQVVNTTNAASAGMTVLATEFDLRGKQLKTATATADSKANAEADLMQMAAPKELGQQVVLVELQMKDAAGAVISRNVYWLADYSSSLRLLNAMPEVKLDTNVASKAGQLRVTLTNNSSTPALAAKLTLLDKATHERILPAYYSDNYVSLLPGESQTVTIDFAGDAKPEVGLRGWNVADATAQ